MIHVNQHFWIKLLIITLLFAPGLSEQATAVDPVQSSLFEVPIEELMDVNVTTASKKSESIYEAPSVMNVVSKEEIEIYGDRNLFHI